jgi:ribosomal protein S21
MRMGNVARAYRNLNRTLRENNVRLELRRQERFESPSKRVRAASLLVLHAHGEGDGLSDGDLEPAPVPLRSLTSARSFAVRDGNVARAYRNLNRTLRENNVRLESLV